MTTPYQEGYEQGEWDTENRLSDTHDELENQIKLLRRTLATITERFPLAGLTEPARHWTLAQYDALAAAHDALDKT